MVRNFKQSVLLSQEEQYDPSFKNDFPVTCDSMQLDQIFDAVCKEPTDNPHIFLYINVFLNDAVL